MSKIGIGITTTKNRNINNNFFKYITQNIQFYINVDNKMEGVSKGRNNCIKNLYENGCDYIFLFDDDCYPIMYGWEQYFIDSFIKSNIHHFTLCNSFGSQLISADPNIIYWDGGLGCFRFMTRELIEKVGYFNTKYDRYGFEDAGYNNRCIRSGICGTGNGYPSPVITNAYIYSEDVYHQNPNVNIVMEDKLKYIERNHPIYTEEINSNQIYYPYEQ